ncbi:MAG: OmpA family protein [Desulfobacteraceae bacterium]
MVYIIHKTEFTKLVSLQAVVLLLCLCFPLLLTAGEDKAVRGYKPLYSENENYSRKRTETLYFINSLRESLNANKQLIHRMGIEKEWLGNRVKKMEERKKPVPWKLYHSLEVKQQKIQQADTENKRLSVLIDKQLKQLGNTEKVDFLTGSGKITEEGQNRGVLPETFKTDLKQNIKKAGISDWVEVSDSYETSLIENSLPILFASGSAVLAKEYRSFLKKLAKVIEKHKVLIQITGYADVDSIHTEKYPSNFELGAARAANIVHELVKAGIKPSVFTISSAGKYRQEARGMSKKKIFERRAEIKIVFLSRD